MMRPGIHPNDYEKWVLDTFGFLLMEEGFENYLLVTTQYHYRVDFSKKGMLVSVAYSLRNDFVDVDIFSNPETIPTIPGNFNESTSLSALLNYDHHPFSYFESLMPYNLYGIEASLKALSPLFRQYSTTIIRGEESIPAARSRLLR